MGSRGFQKLDGIRVFKFCGSVFPLNPSEALSPLLERRKGQRLAAKPNVQTTSSLCWETPWSLLSLLVAFIPHSHQSLPLKHQGGNGQGNSS